jgi:hypothetical protein
MGQVIFGVDFKHSNPKADRAFWIGQTEQRVEQIPYGGKGIDGMDCDTAPYCAPGKDSV